MNILLVLAGIGYIFAPVLSQTQPSCDSKIYCQGDLLDKVQMARIYKNSKTFVDMKMKKSESVILKNFDRLLQSSNQNPSKDELKKFVDKHFQNFNEFDAWTPSDYKDDPAFLSIIEDDKMKKFAQDIVKIWPTLTRKIKKEVTASPKSYSIIPVKNGFVMPGYQFKEFHYWDTFWTIKGLLLCEMHKTVKGMLENFFVLVEQYGFVPNGARIYYLNRSQPPVLTLIMSDYIDATNDISFLSKNIATIDKELTFWLNERTIQVTKNGNKYTLAHYASKSGTPRPESYYEDVHTAKALKNDRQKIQLYADLKSSAESGWEFSSRWLVDANGGNTGGLINAHARRIIPVDLNAILYHNFKTVSDFYTKLGNSEKAKFWSDKAKAWFKSINEVLYNEEEGIWLDFDVELSQPRNYFYPSNLAPLLCQVYNLSDAKEVGRKAVKYLKKQNVLNYEGGVPTSLKNSGQQWDMPSALPPMQHIIIFGLILTGDEEAQEVAEKMAKTWLNSNLAAFNKDGVMYEKYNAKISGQAGGGGKNDAQTGFGWTNGVDLVLINYYYGMKPTPRVGLVATILNPLLNAHINLQVLEYNSSNHKDFF